MHYPSEGDAGLTLELAVAASVCCFGSAYGVPGDAGLLSIQVDSLDSYVRSLSNLQQEEQVA